jgi:hypothetical protein
MDDMDEVDRMDPADRTDMAVHRPCSPSPSISGLALARGFFRDCVAPILARGFPDLRYSAGLLGSGSEVLGYDTEMSRDHHWGPRAMLFLSEEDLSRDGQALHALLVRDLPHEYMGFSTNYSAPDPNDSGVQHLLPPDGEIVNHRVELLHAPTWFRRYLGVEAVDREPTVREWLAVPQQKLRSVVAGELFRDDLDVQAVRERLRWYPDDVWCYVLASCWMRISQDEHLMGRAGYVGDELGSAVIAARLVRDVMRLGFYMERVYPPYAKWFGTAFRELACAEELQPILEQALATRDYQSRGEHLAQAYASLARQHNALGLTEPLDPTPQLFFGRPFPVIFGERFARALLQDAQDPDIQELAKRPLIGSVDLFSDSTDLLEDVSRAGALRGLF